MKKIIYQAGLFLLLSILTISNALAENVLNQARIYINPGHGGWGSNDRPLATINYAILDTLGFFETKSNLMKGLALRDELVKAGAGYVRMSRNRNGIAPSSQSNLNQFEVYEGNGQIVTLSVVCADVETNNMDYFLSIHSNAATEGSTTNYPLLLFRGTDAASGNGLTYARDMARDAWKHIAKNGISYYSAYTDATSNNTRGDITFYGSSTTVAGYTGYLGVLKHGCDGFLSEGSFHTYHPERHRLLSRDYCAQEAVRYSRAIRSWFGDNTETKGFIMGTVKDKNLALTHSLYVYKIGSFDQYKPLNEVNVVLQDANGNTLSTYKTDKDHNGVYVFNNLNPGSYKLVYDIPGYWKETAEIEVTANETTFINKLLSDLSQPDPNIVEEETIVEVADFAHPVQDGDIAAANSYNFAKTNEFSIDSLQNLTVRRALMRNGKYYVLAVDANKKPNLLVINPETGELIKRMSTEGLSTQGYNGKSHLYVLSDIAFTQDGVLLGVNSTVVGRENNSFQTGDFFVYKWQATNEIALEDASPQILLQLPTNTSNSLAAAGNNNSNLVANSFTASGTLDKLRIYFDSHPSDNWGPTDWAVRYVSWNVENGVVTGTQFNNSGLTINAGGLGEDSQISLSPLAPNRFIVNGNKISPFELEMNWMTNDKLQTGAFTANIPALSKGTNYFRYAGRIYMSTPVCEKQTDNTYSYSVQLFDITEGLSKAVKIGETTADIINETTLNNMTGYGVVDNADIDLYLLSGNKSVKYSTKSVAQQVSPARIFAYGLTSAYSEADNGYKIDFKLNEDANAVDLVLTNPTTNEDVKVISLGAKGKGVNQIVLNNEDIPATGEFNWQLRAVAPNVTRFTKISDENPLYNYFAPKGVAIDKSPESPYFGRIYVTNTVAGESAGRNTTTGIYVMAPDASDETGQGNAAYSGGITWTGVNGEGPRKVAVTNDGRVFLADASTTKAGIYYMNPETFNVTSIFPNATVTNGSVKINTTYVCGQIVAIGTRGSGAATQLYAVDKTASGLSWKKNINTYNIGLNNTWSAAPSSSAAAGSYIGNDNSSIVPVSTGYWAGQFRGAGSNTVANPCMFYFSDSFKETVFNTAEFKDKNGVTISLPQASQNGGLAVDEAKGLIALSYNGGVYVFSYKLNKEGVPVVTPKFQHPLDVASVTYDDFTFDYAGNLYAVSNSGKRISVWAMPTDNNSSTIPASKSLIIKKSDQSLIPNTIVKSSVYPNPTDGIITIESTDVIRAIQVYDLSGSMIISLDRLNNNKETIDISNLKSGIYLMRINGSSTVKITRN
jgi:predicted lipoprotein with Yx(FWY)xxD motif